MQEVVDLALCHALVSPKLARIHDGLGSLRSARLDASIGLTPIGNAACMSTVHLASTEEALVGDMLGAETSAGSIII